MVRAWRRSGAEYLGILESAPTLKAGDDLEMSVAMAEQVLRDLDDESITPADACTRLLHFASNACAHSRRTAGGIMMSVTP